MEKENVQFRKNFIWNVLGTGLNAFNSLFFMIIVTRLNGVDQAGIFTIAFSTACIIYFVGVYAGRIYQVTELNKEITDKEFIVNRSISTILMLILVILFSVIRGYNLYKSTMFLLLTLYKALEAFTWGARGQFFWDGNKRTSLLLANKILVSSGAGIMTITDKYMEQFNSLLFEYYNTGENRELKQFLYGNAILGLTI